MLTKHCGGTVRLLGLLAAVCGMASTAIAGEWPQFRGPEGIGVSDEKNLPLTWGGKDNANVCWKVDVPGDDTVTSSPVVAGGRVFITYAIKSPVEHHVLCIKAADGSKLWDTPVEPGAVKKEDNRAGFATPTPCTDGKSVFVAFSSGVVAALDADGKVTWRKDIPDPAFDCAMSVSPVLYGDTLIMLYDRNNKKNSIVGYDKKTGDVKWEEKRPGLGFSHSTPAIVKVKDKPMMLIAAGGQAQGLDPATGKLIWWSKADGDVSSPAFGGGLMYCDGGRGGPGTVVDVTGTGDVGKTNVKWQAKIGESFSSPLIVGDYVYRLAGSRLVCVKAADGSKVYEKELSGITNACSPFVTADGRIYVASAGKSYVIKAGPDFEILGQGDLKDASNASPAPSGGKLFLRGKKSLWCVGDKDAAPGRSEAK